MQCTCNFDLDLFKETADSTTPTPAISFLREVFNVKELLNPSLEQIHGHSLPHCFKFTLRDSSDSDEAIGSKIPVMYYKNWSSESWCSDEEAIVLLKVHNLV